MPVLPLEPFVYPDNLLMQPFAPADPSWRWWVLHTRPRAEKTLARNLLKHQIAFFLPLFPGYVFLLGDNQARIQSLTTNTVAQTLHVVNGEELHMDLARVYHLMSSGAPLAPEDRLLPGTPVEITAGPLAGLEGKIIRKGKRLKFIIEVHFLQRGASVEIDSWMIEPRGS